MHAIGQDRDHAPKPEGQLERSKARRRAAIVGAAQDLIRETGETGLSMRALAERANVSLGTPYNLFGSKQKILIELLNQNAKAFGKLFEAQASTNHLSRIFEYVDMSFTLYHSDPDLYQALLRTIYRSEDAELRTELRRPRARFLKSLLIDAIAAGHLEADLAVDLFSREMFGIYLYSVQEWVHGSVSLERARLETGYGYSLLLMGAALDHAKPELRVRRDRLQSAIEATKRSALPSADRAQDLAVETASKR